jgi:hypothetical protein
MNWLNEFSNSLPYAKMLIEHGIDFNQYILNYKN